MQKIISSSREETLKVGEAIGKKLKKGDIISLTGPLGAGKTVIIKGIAKSLNIEEEITSPSFTIISQYNGRLKLYHIDLYRIDNILEIEDLGFEEILYSDGVTAIEWGEKAESLLPDETIKISINIGQNQTREIILNRVII